MQVYVINKMQFDSLMQGQRITNDNIEQKTDVFLISINNTKYSEKDVKSYFTEDKANLKIVSFDDVDRDVYSTRMSYDANGNVLLKESNQLKNKAISDLQAAELVDFIIANKDKKMCIVHCAAGISRSGAVGEFINELYGESYEIFLRNNPYVIPNTFIKNKLRSAYNNKIKI